MQLCNLIFTITQRGKYFPQRNSTFSQWNFYFQGKVTMSSLNQVNLIGNLGRDPQVLKSTPQGDFVRLTIATTKKYRTKDGQIQEETQWHTVYLSNALGNVASSYLKKGAKIFVSGELRTTVWNDKDDKSYHSTAIYARDVRFLSKKPPQAIDDLSYSVEEKAYGKAIQAIRETLMDH